MKRRTQPSRAISRRMVRQGRGRDPPRAASAAGGSGQARRFHRLLLKLGLLDHRQDDLPLAFEIAHGRFLKRRAQYRAKVRRRRRFWGPAAG